MAIDITEFANVSISVSPVGVASGNFGILGFLTNEEGVVPLSERSRSYTSLASVLEDWAATSEVGLAATSYYGQTPTPTDFQVQMCYETDQAAEVVGGNHYDLPGLVAIQTGTLNITIDGTEKTLSNIDLSGSTSFAEVASKVSTVLGEEASCTYNGTQFVIKSASDGSSSTITYATGTVAVGLGVTQDKGVITQGIDLETPVDALGAALAKGIKPTALVTHKKYRDVSGQATGENTEDIASWCEGAKVIFCNTTNDLSVLSSAISTDIASVLKTQALRYTLTTFSKDSSEYPSASVFGRAASTNFSAVNSTITLNLKQMPGITAEDLTPNEFATLKSKNASAVVNIADQAMAYTDSKMANGSWLDTTHGLMWLENRIEVDMFNAIYVTNTKIPYTQSGINLVEAVLNKSLEAAVNNGLCAPGFLSDGTYLSNGFETTAVSLEDTPTSDTTNRIYKGLSFRMKGAGALHEVEVSGQFEE